jgi:excisionase family DNA binding protein
MSDWCILYRMRSASAFWGRTGIMTTNEPWVSVEEIARHLGVARDSVYRWIESRGLPAHRMGRLWKFKFSQVDAWVEAGGAESENAERGDR